MAAIGRIRKHGVLLMIIIGAALLAFILGDLAKVGNSRETNVAVVGNDKISYQDYSEEVEKTLNNYKQQQGSLSANQTQTIRDNVWENMVKTIIMDEEIKALGLGVSQSEITDQMLGENPNPFVVQSFTNPETGQFDRKNIEGWITSFDSLLPQYQQQWIDFVNYVKEDRLNTKYENLITKGFYVPTKLAERYFDDKNDKVSAELYAIRYSTIPDSTVQITEKDYKKFYNENKYKFKSEDTRDIAYVVFEVKPSETDVQSAQKYVTELKNDFAQIDNVVSFVNANSDFNADTTWKFRTEVPVALESVLFEQNNPVGFVYGPYMDNNAYNMVRIMGYDNSDTAKRVQYAVITREITPSETTFRKVHAEANKFITENKNIDQFNETADREGLNKRVYPGLRSTTSRISGLDNPREIIRWAFDKKTEVGDISTTFNFDNMYVVAAVTNITKEGTMSLKNVMEQQKYSILNQKKGEMMLEKMNAFTDYNQMISDLHGEKTNADLTFDSRSIGNFGIEYSVIGKIMNMEPNTVSAPIAGNTSAFVVKVTAKNQATAPQNYNEIVKERKNLFNNRVNNSQYYSALKALFEIKDNRLIFF